MLQGAAKAAVDQPRRPAGTNDLAVPFEPDLGGGITRQVSVFGVSE